ncbi:MAG: ATP-binding protein [Bacteroidaceae bacterium]|nr:ATP-binding protein [Bacteroidaceae bacterium]
MIQEIKVKNFLSFKDEVTFSFEATKDKTFENEQVITMKDGTRLLRLALLLGANASGKTNLVSAFNFLNFFWHRKPDLITDKTQVIPFLLDKNTTNQSSQFEVKFYANDGRYLYKLEIDQEKVISEELLFYSSNRPALLFSRNFNGKISVVTFNPARVKLKQGAVDEINLKCWKNTSVFSALSQVNINIPEIDPVMKWIDNNCMEDAQDSNLLTYDAKEKMSKDKNAKSYFLNFIKEADINISDVNTKEEKHPIPKNVLNMVISDERIPAVERERIKQQQTYSDIIADFIYSVKNSRGNEVYSLPERLQSEGTIKVFNVESSIYSALMNESFACIDEIDSSLHPRLLRFLILDFLKKKDNKAQLLLTTHYDPILEDINGIFRKDSVWFTEKKENGSTDLYSLVEYKGLNRLSSIRNAYKNGVFGAIPDINL